MKHAPPSRRPRNPRIDLGLAVSGALMLPGQRRTAAEIAAFCGCSRAYIEIIEYKALRKLRHPSRLRVLEEAAGR